MKFIKLSLAVLVISVLAYGGEEKAEFNINGNLIFSNNNIWRGMTQSKNLPFIQGGLNLDYKNFYLGITGSNVKSDELQATSEFDFFSGYTSEAYGIGYDLGMIYYAYPHSSKEANFADVYLGLSKDLEVVKIGAKFYRGVKTNDLEVSNAWETSLSVPLPMSISFDALYGDYTDVGNYYSVGFTKALNDKFKVALSYTGINKDANGADEENVVAAITASF